MAILTGPLLSFEGRGQLAKAVTFRRARLRSIASAYAMPSGPPSAAQEAQRDVFRWLSDLWRFHDPWINPKFEQDNQSGQLPPRNEFMRQNLAALSGQADNRNLICSPGHPHALPALKITATPAVSRFTVTLVPPPLIAGYSFFVMQACAIRLQGFSGPVTKIRWEANKAAAPWTLTTSLLGSGIAYVVLGWYVVQKAGSPNLAGRSISTVATTL